LNNKVDFFYWLSTLSVS